MTDIATLGLAVDSRQVVTAATALDRLTAAAKPAANAATALEKVTKDAAVAHVGLSTQAMAAQHSVRSMVEGLAMGMPITQVFTQQLNHLSYAATGPGGIAGAFKTAGTAMLGLLSPAVLVGGALVAVGVGGALAYVNVAKSAIAFDDVSKAIGTTVGHLHGLESAAAFKGIAQPDFLKAMEKFGGDVYLAENRMGGLAEVFRANNIQAKGFNDYLEKAAELIKNASTDQQRLQILQQMGLPATMQWVQFLSQGKEGIRAATAEAAKFGDTAEGQMIAKARAFDDAWNKAMKNFSTGWRNAVSESASWLSSLNDKATGALLKYADKGWGIPTNLLRNAMNDNAAGYSVGSKLTANSAVDQFYKGTGAGVAGASKPAVDPNVLKTQISLEQQRIGLLGPLATAEDTVRQKQLEINAAALNGVSISKDQAAGLRLVTLAQFEVTRVQTQATLGVFDLTKANKAAADQLQSWITQKLLDPNNPTQYAAALTVLSKQTEQLGENAQVAGSKFEQLKRYQLDAANGRTTFDKFATSSLDTVTNGFADAIMRVKSFKDAVSDMARSVLSDLVKIALRAAIFGPAAGVLGNVASSFGPTMNATPWAFPKFAEGTNNAPGGLAQINERGGEIIDLPSGSRVIPHDVSMQMASRGGGVSFGDTNITIQGNADDKTLQAMQRELASHRQFIASQTKQSASQARYARSGVG